MNSAVERREALVDSFDAYVATYGGALVPIVAEWSLLHRESSTTGTILLMADSHIPSKSAVVPNFLFDSAYDVENLTKFGRMVSLGFTLGACLSDLGRHVGLKNIEDASNGTITLKSLAQELEPYALAERNNGMPFLNALLTIRLVSIIETATQEAVIASLETVSSFENWPEVLKIQGPIAEMIAASPAQRAEFLADALSQQVKAPLKTGAGKYECLLGAVGLSGPIDDTARRILLELLEVRNVLVHRNGRADARLIKNCPWIGSRPGEVFNVRSSMLERYRIAAIYYLMEIMFRWASRAGVVAETTRLELARQDALNRVRQAESSTG